VQLDAMEVETAKIATEVRDFSQAVHALAGRASRSLPRPRWPRT